MMIGGGDRKIESLDDMLLSAGEDAGLDGPQAAGGEIVPSTGSKVVVHTMHPVRLYPGPVPYDELAFLVKSNEMANDIANRRGKPLLHEVTLGDFSMIAATIASTRKSFSHALDALEKLLFGGNDKIRDEDGNTETEIIPFKDTPEVIARQFQQAMRIKKRFLVSAANMYGLNLRITSVTEKLQADAMKDGKKARRVLDLFRTLYEGNVRKAGAGNLFTEGVDIKDMYRVLNGGVSDPATSTFFRKLAMDTLTTGIKSLFKDQGLALAETWYPYGEAADDTAELEADRAAGDEGFVLTYGKERDEEKGREPDQIGAMKELMIATLYQLERNTDLARYVRDRLIISDRLSGQVILGSNAIANDPFNFDANGGGDKKGKIPFLVPENGGGTRAYFRAPELHEITAVLKGGSDGLSKPAYALVLSNLLALSKAPRIISEATLRDIITRRATSFADTDEAFDAILDWSDSAWDFGSRSLLEPDPKPLVPPRGLIPPLQSVDVLAELIREQALYFVENSNLGAPKK